MDNLVQYIQQTLSQGGCVSVAQAGVFTLERVSSYVEDGKLHPPCTQLVFTANPSLKSTSIPQIWYVEPALMKDEMMAAQQSLARSLQQFVGMQDRFQIPGWGVFVKEAGSARYILQTSTGADDPISFPVLMESMGVSTQGTSEPVPAAQSAMERVAQPAAQVPPVMQPAAVFSTPSSIGPQPQPAVQSAVQPAVQPAPQPVIPAQPAPQPAYVAPVQTAPQPQPVSQPEPVLPEPQPAPAPATPGFQSVPQSVPAFLDEQPRPATAPDAGSPYAAPAAGQDAPQDIQGHIYQPAREYTSGSHHHHPHHHQRNKMIVLVRRILLLFVVLGIAAFCMHRYVAKHPELQVLKESAVLPDSGSDSTKPASKPVSGDSLGQGTDSSSNAKRTVSGQVSTDSSSILTPEEALGLVPSSVPAAARPVPADSVTTPTDSAASQPVASDSSTSEPAASQSAASQPAISQPAASQPATAKAQTPVAEAPAATPKKQGLDDTVHMPSASRRYYVVVASLPSAEQALAHKRSLTRQGAVSLSIYQFSETTYRIVAGACETQDEARTLLDEVKVYSPSAWICQYR